MNITEYIAAYLRQGKTVELPGIGTFATKQVNAHYNSADDTFAPSHEILTFDHYTRGDKGIVRFIAEQECIGESTAERMFRNYMDVLLEKLDKEHCHHFPGIGVLHKEGNEISFKPETVMPPQDAVPQRPTLTGVKTYNHVAHDPFAQFEQEFQSTPTPQTQVVEETVVVVEEEISITVNDDEGDNENAADKLSAAEQALQNLKAQLTQPQEEVNDELQEEYEEDGCNGDIPDEEAFEEEESTEEASTEEPADNSTHDALSSLQEMEKLPPATNTEDHHDTPGKKKRHPWRVVIILLLLLLLGSAAYYYFKVYRPAGEEAIPAAEEQQDESGNTDIAEETAPGTKIKKEISYFVTENGDTLTIITKRIVEDDGSDMVRSNNDFTFSSDNIEYTATDVTRISNNISDYLASYIHNYARSQRYSQAADLLQEKVQQYAEVRLSEILSNKPFNVMEFFNFCENDYMHIYYEKDLKVAHSARQRIAVQREVMNEALLYKLLQEVISENNITADAVRPAAPKQTAVPQAASQSTSKKGFDIIAGFYVNRASADKMANNLKKKGCDAYIINKDGLYYVSMGSAGSQTAAEALYHHIKEWYKGDIAIKKW